MSADVLTLCPTEPSADLLLTMQDKQVFVFHEEIFQISMLSEMIEKANIL